MKLPKGAIVEGHYRILQNEANRNADSTVAVYRRLRNLGFRTVARQILDSSQHYETAIAKMRMRA